MSVGRWTRGCKAGPSNGETLFEAAAPASGVVLWNAAAAGGGTHTLTHESGGVTLTALFTPPENLYRVRLHGNGAMTEEGEEWVDLEGEFGETVFFPKGVFTQGKKLSGDVSGWLKGWWPGRAAFDVSKDEEKDLWTEGVTLQEKNIEEWKRLGWVEDIDGVPTAHFYAVWASEVLVGVHGAYGGRLSLRRLRMS